MLTDPIADFLNKIRNANRAGHAKVFSRPTKVLVSIAELLTKKGFLKGSFVEDIEIEGKRPQKKLVLLLNPAQQFIELKRVSKPGQRIYVGMDEIKKVKNGLGIGIISTSRGIMSESEARKNKMGGEYICKVY